MVPFALTYSGAHGDQSYIPITVPLRWVPLGVLLALSSAAGLMLNRLRIPNAFFFGPLAYLNKIEGHIGTLPDSHSLLGSLEA